MSSFKLIRVPYLLPISADPIQEAALLIEDDILVSIGRFEEVWKHPQSKTAIQIELPDTVLLPGFVNAHCHLELTALQGLQYPGSFSAWITKLIRAKSDLSVEQIQMGFQRGLAWLLQTGTTTVADHVSVGTDWSLLKKSPLRYQIFLESLGVNPELAEQIYELGEKSEVPHIHLSPHSVHALHPPLLEKLLKSSRPLFSIHLAESKEEEEYFKRGSGKLFEFIREKNPKSWFENLTMSSIQYLNKKKLLSDKILAIHCNYVDDEDIQLLQKHKMSVVHCPSSHAYFGHQRFELEKLRQAGLNIALGTDSLSSGDSLSMLDQVRLARKNYPEIPASEWLRMLTLNGARALKMEREIGSLELGKKADIIGFKFSNFSGILEDLAENVLEKKQVDFILEDT
ncbi:MAG: amidohydrolase family protein [Deltaproteobacteria bacterium]|nr:amidohydrolase family protein [Deltaproteobacteria bacterium]